MKGKQIIVTVFFLIYLLHFSSCEALLVGDVLDDTPVNNFELLWEEFDLMYGLFIAKGVDWDDSYNRYRPLVHDDMSDRELYEVITAMLDELNDNHVSMYTDNMEYTNYSSGIYGTLGPNLLFDISLIRDKYLTNRHVFAEWSETVYCIWGLIGDDIGYLYLRHFETGMDDLEKIMDEFISATVNCRGIIVDIRNNFGGSDNEGKYIAGRFASERLFYMHNRFRNGPACVFPCASLRFNFGFSLR